MGAIDIPRPLITYKRTGKQIGQRTDGVGMVAVGARVTTYEGTRFVDGAARQHVNVAVIRPEYDSLSARFAATSEPFAAWLANREPDTFRALRGNRTIEDRLAPLVVDRIESTNAVHEMIVESPSDPNRDARLTGAAYGIPFGAMSASLVALGDPATMVIAGIAGLGAIGGAVLTFFSHRALKRNIRDSATLNTLLLSADTYLQEFFMTPGNELEYRRFLVDFIPSLVGEDIAALQLQRDHLLAVLTALRQRIEASSDAAQQADWRLQLQGLTDALDTTQEGQIAPLEQFLAAWRVFATRAADQMVADHVRAAGTRDIEQQLRQITAAVAGLEHSAKAVVANMSRLLGELRPFAAAVTAGHRSLLQLEAPAHSDTPLPSPPSLTVASTDAGGVSEDGLAGPEFQGACVPES